MYYAVERQTHPEQAAAVSKGVGWSDCTPKKRPAEGALTSPLERYKIAHGGLEVQIKIQIPLRRRHTGAAQQPADLRDRHPGFIAQLGIRPAQVVRRKRRLADCLPCCPDTVEAPIADRLSPTTPPLLIERAMWPPSTTDSQSSIAAATLSLIGTIRSFAPLPVTLGSDHKKWALTFGK